MNAPSRASTGARLEEAALAAARGAAAGQAQAAQLALDEIRLLLAVATELRDLTGAEQSRVQGVVDRARQSLR